MPLTINHSVTVVTPDDPAYEVGSDEWNAAHTIEGTFPVASGGTGQTTEADAFGAMISALTEDTTPAQDDYIVTYDVSADTGKKVSLSSFDRTVLTGNTTFYVRADGSDSNDGSADTSGSAWLTIQHAYDTIVDTYDFSGYDVEIKVGNGTYTPSGTLDPLDRYPYSAVLLAYRKWSGGGSMHITGNVADPTQCYIHADGFNSAGMVNLVAQNIFVGGFKVDSDREGFRTQNGATFTIYDDTFMSRCTDGLFVADGFGGFNFPENITVTIDGTLSGTSAGCWIARNSAGIGFGIMDFVFTNTPRITVLALSEIDGNIFNNGATFTGNFTGYQFINRYGGISINCYNGVSGYPDGGSHGISYPDSATLGNRQRIRDLLLTESLGNVTNLAVTRDTTEIWGYIDKSAKVNFKFTVWYSTPTAADFKFDLDGQGATPTLLVYTVRYIGPDDTSMTTKGIYTSFNQLFTILASTGTFGYAEIEGIVHNSASANFDLTFRWAKNSSNAGLTKLYAGSCATVSRFA